MYRCLFQSTTSSPIPTPTFLICSVQTYGDSCTTSWVVFSHKTFMCDVTCAKSVWILGECTLFRKLENVAATFYTN